mmetsp:Transcript_34028/g.77040  ORF Transcript_34028/g.77040 Transcript_34028/m.77040 type:complete len:203 (-) Transcript_34028:39-647(-)
MAVYLPSSPPNWRKTATAGERPVPCRPSFCVRGMRRPPSSMNCELRMATDASPRSSSQTACDNCRLRCAFVSAASKSACNVFASSCSAVCMSICRSCISSCAARASCAAIVLPSSPLGSGSPPPPARFIWAVMMRFARRASERRSSSASSFFLIAVATADSFEASCSSHLSMVEESSCAFCSSASSVPRTCCFSVKLAELSA